MKSRVIAVALFLSVSLPVAGNAFAADTPFGTAVIFGFNSSNTVCYIHNSGSKPVTIRSVAIPNFNLDGENVAATFDDCTDAPLQPGHTCHFEGSLGAFGGGIAKVKGSTKSLRGDCTLYVGVEVIATAPMR